MASLRRSIVASVVFTLFGGPGIVLLLMPWWITRLRMVPGWNEVAGWLLIVAGVIPLLESICRFILVGHGALVPAVPTEHLVVSGLYRYVRNPMYVGVAMALTGEAILFWNRGMVIELTVVIAAFDIFVRFYEEPKLVRTFGDVYLSYHRQVRRWIPRLKPWNP